MSDTKISEAAVEAAASEMYSHYHTGVVAWCAQYDSVKEHWREQARIALAAALPHLHPQPAELAEQQEVELPPLPPVDGYDKRVHGHYSAEQMRDYARNAIRSAKQEQACSGLGIDKMAKELLERHTVAVPVAVEDGRCFMVREQDALDAIRAALAATGKQQVGEVQRDTLDAVVEAICYDEHGIQVANVSPVVRERIRSALAARQPGAHTIETARALGERTVASVKLIGTLADLPEHVQKVIQSYAGLCVRSALLHQGGQLPAQGIDLGQFIALAKFGEEFAFSAEKQPHSRVVYSQASRLLALIDQRDAAPGVGNG